jgi:hypothetical protein
VWCKIAFSVVNHSNHPMKCHWVLFFIFIRFYFFCIIGRGCLLSLLSFSSYCCVWQHHHHFLNYFYAPHKWHYIIFKVVAPPLLLKVLSTSKIILFHVWYLDIYVYVYVYPPLSISFCLWVFPNIFWWVSKQSPLVVILLMASYKKWQVHSYSSCGD